MQNPAFSAPACGLLAFCVLAAPAAAQDDPVLMGPPPRDAVALPGPLAEGVSDETRVTAVALNYCRAALHRIRRRPTPQVLREERTRILDNLNLSGIADAEVIALYSALLDEINGVTVSRTQTRLTGEHHARSIRRKAVWDTLAFTTQLATAQFASAVRTGADSWWDVRDMGYRRDSDLLKIERERMASVVDKSQLFLDTFWKLARKRQIPDAWLVRGQDLDRLAAANSEEDAAVRLRRLSRLEAYLAAYPPYWYHLARTRQELGQSAAAVETYAILEQLQKGRFRVDEMLAASLANMALLEDELGRSAAGETAARALAAAPDVWQANLAAARVLQRTGRVAMSEEAILRNVDGGLEMATSQTFRLGLYYHAGDAAKVRAALADPDVVRHAAAPAVVRCLAMLPAEDVPAVAVAELSRSLAAYPQLAFGSDELLIAADDRWRLAAADWSFPVLEGSAAAPQVTAVRGGHTARLSGPFEWGNPIRGAAGMEVEMMLTYPDSSRVTLTLRELAGTRATARPIPGQRSMPRTVLAIAAVRAEGTLISFAPSTPVRAAELPGEYAVE